MKEQFKTWGWYKTYQISEFHYNKITLEDTFPKTMSDDDCIDDLDRRIEAQARRKYPHLFVEKTWITEAAYVMPGGPIQFNGNEHPPDEETLFDKIRQSKNQKELKGWELLIKVEKDPVIKMDLLQDYSKKMDELQDVSVSKLPS